MNPNMNSMAFPNASASKPPSLANAPGTLDASIETVGLELSTLEDLTTQLLDRLYTVSHTASPASGNGVAAVGDVLPPSLDRLRFLAMRIAGLNDRLRDQMDRLAL